MFGQTWKNSLHAADPSIRAISKTVGAIACANTSKPTA
jgi:hypothetical protein